MLQNGFVEGLKWLGKKGYSFDLGVDQHSGGKWQLEEALEMIEKAHEGVPEEEKVTFIISTSFDPMFWHAILMFFQTTSANPICLCTTKRTRVSWHGGRPCSGLANVAKRI
jgi:hypothetical protein